MSTSKFEEIICIQRDGQFTDCRCITWVKTRSGQPYSVNDVIHLITNAGYVFYVSNQSGDVALVKAVPNENPTYIRTKAEDTPTDNLLQLPDCPEKYQ